MTHFCPMLGSLSTKDDIQLQTLLDELATKRKFQS